MFLKISRWIVGIFCIVVVSIFVLFVVTLTIDRNASNRADREDFAAQLQARLSTITDVRARTVILNRVTLGQALECKIDKDEILSLMSLTSAMVAAFTNSDPEADAIGNDAFKMGVEMQKNRSGAPCSSVADGVQKIKEYARSQGLR